MPFKITLQGLASGEREIELLENILSIFFFFKASAYSGSNSRGVIAVQAVPSITWVQLPKGFRGCDPPAKRHP